VFEFRKLQFGFFGHLFVVEGSACAAVKQRVVPAVAWLLVGPPMLERWKDRSRKRRATLAHYVGGSAEG